jgi:hypothetical protein
MYYINGVQSVNTDGSIDYDNGYTLEPDGTLYDANNNIVASDVISFNDNTGVVTYSGGNTETLAEINQTNTTQQTGTVQQSFFATQTPLYLGGAMILLSFFVKEK